MTWLGVVVAMALLLGTAPLAGAQTTTAPTLRLTAGTSKVTLQRFGTRVPLDLGVLVAAQGGSFEVQARRARFDAPVTAAQVDPSTGAVIRDIPAELVDGWSGLRRFARVTFRDRRGNVVANKRLTFCPNAWQRQRVGDAGPRNPTYPVGCFAHFPFLRGMAWGIDADWASPLGGGDDFWEEGTPAFVRVPEGRYEVTVRITKAHADLFDIPRADRVVRLNVTVKQAAEDWDDVVEAHGLATGGTGGRVTPFGSVPTVRDPQPSMLPDLTALPAWSLGIERRRGRDVLAFAASPWNAGPAPLVVEGFRRPGEDVMDAYQYFFDADGDVVGRARVGTMRYHAGGPRRHNHWHFLQFVSFELLDAERNQVVRSRKQGFCLAPTDPVDLTVRRADFRPRELGQGTVCGDERAVWVREVLEAGWGDTYFQSGPREAFDITDLPNGRYLVKVHVNPRGKLYDRRATNDIAVRRVRLGGRPGNRTVRVSAWRGSDA